MKRTQLLGIVLRPALVVALAAMFCFILVGCTATSSAPEPSPESSEPSPFVGRWEIVSQEKVHNEDLEAEKAAGNSRFFTLNEDGTLTSEFKGVTSGGTYKQTSDTAATLKSDDPMWSEKMTLEDRLLVVIGADGLRYRFEKLPEGERSDGSTSTSSGASSASSTSTSSSTTA